MAPLPSTVHLQHTLLFYNFAPSGSQMQAVRWGAAALTATQLNQLPTFLAIFLAFEPFVGLTNGG